MQYSSLPLLRLFFSSSSSLHFFFRDVLVEQKHFYIHISTTGTLPGSPGADGGGIMTCSSFFFFFVPFSFFQKSKVRHIFREEAVRFTFSGEKLTGGEREDLWARSGKKQHLAAPFIWL